MYDILNSKLRGCQLVLEYSLAVPPRGFDLVQIDKVNYYFDCNWVDYVVLECELSFSMLMMDRHSALKCRTALEF